ncbi:MAG: tetratricopeptide repeat protein [Desulfomonilaceae bacterium]
MATARRNAPCPCGSGKKFKNCCLPSLPKQSNKENEIPENSLQQEAVQAFKAMSEKKWDDAIDNFKECLEEDPHNSGILQAVAACYDGLEDYLRAAEYYEKALAVEKEINKTQILYRLGVSRACASRIEKAKESFEEVFRMLKTPQEKEAVQKILDELSAISSGEKPPSSFLAQAQLQRAFSDFEDEDYEMAAARLEKVSVLDPENSAVFYNLGVAYTFLKKDQAALDCFEKTVELDPDYVTAYYNMGQIYLLVKRDFSRALNCFDRAISFRENYIGAYHQKGVAYEMLGDLGKAVECWRKTLDLDPHNQQALGNIQRVQTKTS